VLLTHQNGIYYTFIPGDHFNRGEKTEPALIREIEEEGHHFRKGGSIVLRLDSRGLKDLQSLAYAIDSLRVKQFVEIRRMADASTV
jgi:hypothetical protein